MAEYEAYKDSGAVWIGKIPAEWTVTRLKNHLRRTDARNPGGVQVLSLYRELGIVPKDSRDDNHNVTSEDTSNYKYVQPGNFVVNKMKAWQGSVAVSDYEGIVSPAYYVYKFLDNSFHKRYFHYLIRSCYKEEFMSLSAGIRIGQWDLSSQDLDNVPVLIPTLTEQATIAEYLDRETERIDAVISEARVSIEEYKAWKAAEIDESIKSDKGSYKKAKLRNVCSFHNGDRSKNYPSPEEFTNDGIPFAGADALNGMYVDTQAVRFISKEKYDSMGGLKIKKHDILYTLRGSTIGKNAMAMFDDGTVASSLMGIRVVNPDLCIPEYLLYWLNSYEEYWQRDTCINGSTAPNLSAEDVKSFVIYLPSVDTQHQIVSKLNKRIGAIDALVLEKELLIEDLEAYKKSLIFEVVTGKRRVIE